MRVTNAQAGKKSTRPPIFGFNSARDSMVESVVARVCESLSDARLVLIEAAFLETTPQQSSGVDDVVPLVEWRALARSLGRMSEDDCARRLRDLATRYARDVAGNFDSH